MIPEHPFDFPARENQNFDEKCSMLLNVLDFSDIRITLESDQIYQTVVVLNTRNPPNSYKFQRESRECSVTVLNSENYSNPFRDCGLRALIPR